MLIHHFFFSVNFYFDVYFHLQQRFNLLHTIKITLQFTEPPETLGLGFCWQKVTSFNWQKHIVCLFKL